MCQVAGVVRTAPANVKRAREGSLSVKGAKMFNLLPKDLRNFESDKADLFKGKLDRFLQSIADQPTISEEGRAAESNCLLHQIPMSTNIN